MFAEHLQVVFFQKCRVVRWLDPDTVLTDPLTTGMDEFTRIRLKDEYLPEIGDPEEPDLTARQNRDFPVGSYLWATNTRHHMDHERLEARIDPAPARGGMFADWLILKERQDNGEV